MVEVIELFLNVLPILVFLGLLFLFGRWVNRHTSFDFNVDDSRGRAVVRVLRPVVVIGAILFTVVVISLSIKIIAAIA